MELPSNQPQDASHAALPAGTLAVAPTLQHAFGATDLGALIMGMVPLPDRVRLRGLCRAFQTAVDASLHACQSISSDDLFALDRGGRSTGCVLMWLARKCPNLQALEAQGAPGAVPMQSWWRIPVANSVVVHLATHCRQLQTLNLRGAKGVRDTGLQAVAAHCGSLRFLNVGGCELVTHAGVLAIAAGCCQLEHLDVGWNQKVTDASMVAIAAHCPHLRHLNVQGTFVGSAGINAIARGCPGLQSLDVRWCECVDDDGVVTVAECCPLLEMLESGGAHVGDRGTAAVMFHCTQLRKLCLSYGTGTEAIRLGPDSCRQLRSLTIASRHLTDDAFVAVAARCSQLTHLVFDERAATDASLAKFAARCPHLEELHIPSNEEVTDAGVLAVARNCPRLRTVDVYECKGVTDASLVELAGCCPGLQVLKVSGSYVGNRAFHALGQHCPSLRSLDVSDPPYSIRWVDRGRRYWQASPESCVKDDGLAAVLRNCLRLEVLNLTGCRGLTDAGIKMVGDSCKHLQELGLRNRRGCFTDRGLAAMAPNLAALEVLDAYKCDAVTNASVMALSKHCPRLKDVDVSECQVGDEGIISLARHCALVTLKARNCKGVTDASMEAISEHCGQLDNLDVSGCVGVTATGVMAVASKCKGLRGLSVKGHLLAVTDIQYIRAMCRNLLSLEGP